MKIIFLILIQISTLAFAETAVLSKIKGTVKVGGIVVHDGMIVRANNEVTALGKESSVVLTFEDGSKTLLRNGSLKIESTKADNVTLLSLARGLIFVSKNKSKQTLKVTTRSATMGIRGTKFYVEEDPAKTYLCVCEGIVEITNGKSTALVKKNEDVTVTPKNEFKKSAANQMMIDMAREGFVEMGLLSE